MANDTTVEVTSLPAGCEAVNTDGFWNGKDQIVPASRKCEMAARW